MARARLVLFETSVRHIIWHTRHEYGYPTNEVIDAVGKLETGFLWYDFPIGWTYTYLQEGLDNPFQMHLPQFWPLGDFLIPQKKAKKRKKERLEARKGS